MDDPSAVKTASRRSHWPANAVLALAALYCALLALRAAGNGVPLSLDDWLPAHFAASACACAVVLLGLSLRLPAPARSNVALLVAASGASVLAIEALLSWQGGTWRDMREEVTVSYARAAGRPVGSLDTWEVIRRLRREGATEAVPFFGSANRGYVSTADGVRLRILAGVSRATTVSCNESGRFEPYLADEHGFNNPPGLHGTALLDVVTVGDSYTHSPCVPPAASTAGRIRTLAFPHTLNLGIRGAGPLSGLAALIEYGSPAQPKVVVWNWYEGNDLQDLQAEMQDPALRRYLAEPVPSGLAALQGEIDLAWRRQAVRAEVLDRFLPVADLLLLRSTRGRLNLLNHPPITRVPLSDAEDVLFAAREAVRGWGGRLLMVYLPDAERYCGVVDAWRRECDPRLRRYMRGALNQRDDVLALFERLGAPVVDGHAAFLETGRPGDMFFHPFSHYSPEGYRVVADAVLRELEPMLDTPPARPPAASPRAATNHR